MTAKEKATEIFNSHHNSIMEYGEYYSEEILCSILAIKASVITVEEFIKEVKLINPNNNCYELIGALEYWQKVKQELLSL